MGIPTYNNYRASTDTLDNHKLCLSRQYGRSSLMYASENGHVEVVDKLLQHGATVDLQKEVHTLYVHNAMQANTCAKRNLRTVR